MWWMFCRWLFRCRLPRHLSVTVHVLFVLWGHTLHATGKYHLKMDDWKTLVSFSDGLLAAAMFQGVYRSVPVFSLIAMILLVLEWLHSWDSLVLHIFLAELEQHRHELSMKLTWKKNKTEVVCYNCQVFWVEVPSWDTCDTHGERERERTAKEEGKSCDTLRSDISFWSQVVFQWNLLPS